MPLLRLKESYNPHPLRWWHWPLLILLIAGTIYCALEYNGLHADEQEENAPFQHNAGTVFGTIYHLTYQHPRDLQQEVDSLLEALDMDLSPFNEHSNIRAINEGRTTLMASRLRQVVELALQVPQTTNGAFDITVAPLVNAWGFGWETADQLPSTATLDSLRRLVGYQQLTLHADTLIKANPRLTIDCAAIAKGFAVDEVADFLEHNGADNYMVEIGGEIRLHGHNPSGENWHIGVNQPNDSLEGMAAVLSLQQAAIATSGNYRNFYVKEGRKVAHTIDPRTGMPVSHSLLSATVLAPSCAEADAYATAFMVLGLDSTQRLLQQRPRLQAFLIYADSLGQLATWATDSLANAMEREAE